MRRKKTAVLLAALLLLSLSGCGSKSAEETVPPEMTTAAETNASTTSAADTTTAATTTQPTGTTATETAATSTNTGTAATTTNTAPAVTQTVPATTGKATTAPPKATTQVRPTVRTPATQPPAPAAEVPEQTAAPEPQTEVTLSPEETPIEAPAGWTWYLEDAVFDGTSIAVPVKVREDPGIYGYNMNLLIDGMSIADAGFTLADVEQGDAYGFETFLANLEKGNIAGAEMTQKVNHTAGQDATVAVYYLIPPEDAQPGQTYTVSITGLSVGNYAGQNFNESNGIQTVAATITIPAAAETEAPSET